MPENIPDSSLKNVEGKEGKQRMWKENKQECRKRQQQKRMSVGAQLGDVQSDSGSTRVHQTPSSNNLPGAWLASQQEREVVIVKFCHSVVKSWPLDFFALCLCINGGKDKV